MSIITFVGTATACLCALLAIRLFVRLQTKASLTLSVLALIASLPVFITSMMGLVTLPASHLTVFRILGIFALFSHNELLNPERPFLHASPVRAPLITLIIRGTVFLNVQFATLSFGLQMLLLVLKTIPANPYAVATTILMVSMLTIGLMLLGIRAQLTGKGAGERQKSLRLLVAELRLRANTLGICTLTAFLLALLNDHILGYGVPFLAVASAALTLFALALLNFLRPTEVKIP